LVGTGNWKGAERYLADVLCKYSIDAYRKTRGSNFAVSDTDVGVVGEDWLKLDSKYSKAAPFRHHGKIQVIEEKYCKDEKDEPILFTKNFRERSGYITIKAEFFAVLISFWLGKATKEQLEEIYYGHQ
jgi:hypothetical protein